MKGVAFSPDELLRRGIESDDAECVRRAVAAGANCSARWSPWSHKAQPLGLPDDLLRSVQSLRVAEDAQWAKLLSSAVERALLHTLKPMLVSAKKKTKRANLYDLSDDDSDGNDEEKDNNNNNNSNNSNNNNNNVDEEGGLGSALWQNLQQEIADNDLSFEDAVRSHLQPALARGMHDMLGAFVTPIGLALQSGSTTALRALLHYGGARVDVNAPAWQDATPLMWVIERSQSDMLRVLLERGAKRPAPAATMLVGEEHKLFLEEAEPLKLDLWMNNDLPRRVIHDPATARKMIDSASVECKLLCDRADVVRRTASLVLSWQLRISQVRMTLESADVRSAALEMAQTLWKECEDKKLALNIMTEKLPGGGSLLDLLCMFEFPVDVAAALERLASGNDADGASKALIFYDAPPTAKELTEACCFLVWRSSKPQDSAQWLIDKATGFNKVNLRKAFPDPEKVTWEIFLQKLRSMNQLEAYADRAKKL